MRVLINAVAVGVGGATTALHNLLPAFVEVDGGRNEYGIVTRDDVRARLDVGHPRISFHRSRTARSFFSRLCFEQLGVAAQAAWRRPDVLLAPGNTAIAAAPVPQVIIFRNLAPFDPDAIARDADPTRLRMLRALGVASARIVRKVVFMTEYARRIILPQLAIDASKTACVPLGRNPSFSPAARVRAPDVLSRLGVQGPYVLSVGHFYPYKNLVELVVGFGRAREALPKETSLVVAGEETEPGYAASVRRTITREGLDGRVRIVGSIPYDDLPALYAGAALFVFSSTCENFPNTLVEALASGVPTISSNAGPMPEIAGDGAAYFDPHDPDDIASALVRYWTRPDEARSLAERGLTRVHQYSWPETARRLLGVLEEAAG